MNFSATSYQPEIQGIRGISVALVVLYHANLIFHGGFIGVDVFFVVSGFVITKSIVNEYARNGFVSARHFISRRIRRLLPASTIVIAFTLICSIFVFSPFGEQRQISYASLSATFFSANLYFILQNSYAALANNPLRHMWSLGVEEQFYLFLIIFIVILSTITKSKKTFFRYLLCFSLVTGLFSFFAGLVLSNGVRLIPLPTRVAFFSPVSRLWEIQVGVLLALSFEISVINKIRNRFADLLSILGLFLIFFSAYTFNAFTNYPGTSALLPTFGSALLILSISKSELLKKALCSKPLVFLGDLSYSIYLWHWPLIVMCGVIFPGQSNLIVFSALFSVVPAYFSYIYVENRFRESSDSKIEVKQILGVSILIQVVLALTLLVGAHSGLGITQESAKNGGDSWADRANCEMDGSNFDYSNCFVESSGNIGSVLLLGDSQAGSISDGVKKAADELNLNFAVWYNNGCPVFPRPSLEREDCLSYLEYLPSVIKEINPSLIIIANKSTLYTTGGPQRGGVTIAKSNGDLVKTYSEAIQMWTDGLIEVVNSESFVLRNILVIQQVPPTIYEGQTLLKPKLGDSPFDLRLSADRNELVKMEKSTIGKYKHVNFYDPAVYLCPLDRCKTVVEEGRIYTDNYHLSPIGAIFLSDSLKESIGLAIK